MELNKKYIFALLVTVFLILGLTYFKMFYLTVNKIPLAFLGALIGLVFTEELDSKNLKNILYVLLTSIFGFAIAALAYPNPNSIFLGSSAILFAILLVVPSLSIKIRDKLFSKS